MNTLNISIFNITSWKRLTKLRTHLQKYSTILSRLFCISAMCHILVLKKIQMPHLHTLVNFKTDGWKSLEIFQFACRILRKVQIPNIRKVVLVHEIQKGTNLLPKNYIPWHSLQNKALSHLKFISEFWDKHLQTRQSIKSW